MENQKTPSMLFPLFLFITILAIIGFYLYIRKDNYIIMDRKVKYRIDKVEYHPSGGDNTLQISPYWKLHLEGVDLNITQYREFNIGDSIEIIERRIIGKNKGM